MSQFRESLKFSLCDSLYKFIVRLRGSKIGEGCRISHRSFFERCRENITLHDNVVIKDFARIAACNKHACVEIGRNTTIGFNTIIYASCSIKIGQNCMIAPFCNVVDSNHGTVKNLNMNEQENVSQPIVICDDVWIGGHCTILKGVTINHGAVVAAGSVVTHDVKSYEIVGGSPARKIGERI